MDPVGSSSDGVPKATSSFIDSNDRLEEQVSQFWKIEATDVLKKDKAMSVNDKKVMEIWERDIQREGAHFQLPVPFRRRPPNLPDNKWSAEQRLKSLARRLQRDQAMYVKYKQGIEDLLRKGYAEEVSEETRQPKDTPVWYLPHHPVLNPQKPDKMRIVFDCAAKHQGVSLNDAVLQGPDLINNLMGVLLRFRQQPVALMCLVEAIINGRPLTITSDDARDAEPLTPNHLLLLRSKNALPPDVFQKHDLYGRRRWRQIQYLADLFWRRWVKEYLPSLQQRQKWLKETRNLEEGDIVLIIDNLPRNKWLTGRVIETYPGKDKLVRSVKLKHSTGILVRPVQKLCLLEEADSVLVNHSD